MAKLHYTSEEVNLTPDSPVAVEKSVQRDHVPRHRHDFIEIVFVAAGSAFYTQRFRDGEERSGCLVQGDVFSVLRGERHGFEQCRSLVFYNIFLQKAFIDTLTQLKVLPGWELLFGHRQQQPRGVGHIPAGDRLYLTQLLDRLVAESRARQPGFRMLLPALVTEFLVSVMRSDTLIRPHIAPEEFGILQIISLMEKEPARRFTLDSLARHIHVSTSTLLKKFRAATGAAPMEYLLKLRLQMGEKLLLFSDLPIHEIAETCGFCATEYFIRLFRREYGDTPAAHRKKMRARSESGGKLSIC